jgi:hypothetical protein
MTAYLWLAALLLLAPAENHDPETGRLTADSIIVVVKNVRIDEVTVYAQFHGRGRRRVGRVEGNAQRSFVISWSNAELTMFAQGPGEQPQPSNPVSPRVGDRYEFTVHPSFQPISLRLVGPGPELH